ncbi:MAG: GFA family protein [Granulosicoccus sp.]|nr:GFA family protein [Granulosicoccus sp.]
MAVSDEGLAGGCVCGSVRFRCQGEPARITICHCLWCQRRTGSAFGVEVVYLESQVNISGTAQKIHRFNSDESGRWLDMHFCGSCGTNLGLTLEVRSGIRSLPAGAFDDPSWFEHNNVETRHVYMRSRRRWVDPIHALITHHDYFT